MEYKFKINNKMHQLKYELMNNINIKLNNYNY